MSQQSVITEYIEITPGVLGGKPRIEITPDVCGGRPRIAGHRIRVQDVVFWHEKMGL